MFRLRRQMFVVAFAVLASVLASASASAHTVTSTVAIDESLAAPVSAPRAAASAEGAAASLAVPAPAEDGARWSSGTETESAATVIVVGALLVALLVRRRPRRALASLLILLAFVFAFESELHRVHHLGEAQASDCSVASAAAHLSGAPTGVVVLQGPWAVVAQHVDHVRPVVPSREDPRPSQGRAPPAVLV